MKGKKRHLRSFQIFDENRETILRACFCHSEAGEQGLVPKSVFFFFFSKILTRKPLTLLQQDSEGTVVLRNCLRQ